MSDSKRKWQFGALACLVFVASETRANLLANPGFEGPTGFEDPSTCCGPPFVGRWVGFVGGAATISAAMPRTGAQHLDLSKSAGESGGVFQHVPNLTPGQTGVFGGWHKTTSSSLDVVVEVYIQWWNSVSQSTISFSPFLHPVPTSQYTPFTMASVVPAGADTASVVYALQIGTSGTVFVDDMSFVVPEPSTLSIGLFAAVAGLSLQRRRW
jgi:hypothetical protein